MALGREKRQRPARSAADAREAKPSPDAGLIAIFAHLKQALAKHSERLLVVQDEPALYSLDSRKRGPNGKHIFFGSVAVRKRYVSFHLMPIYMNPELLDDTTAEVRALLSGKSCFSIKRAHPEVLRAFDDLVDRAFELWRKSAML